MISDVLFEADRQIRSCLEDCEDAYKHDEIHIRRVLCWMEVLRLRLDTPPNAVFPDSFFETLLKDERVWSRIEGSVEGGLEVVNVADPGQIPAPGNCCNIRLDVSQWLKSQEVARAGNAASDAN